MKRPAAFEILALRGAAAAAIAIAFTTVLKLQRPYWVIMIAVVLVNQTTGQSLRRSGERVATTLAGFSIGWLLQWTTRSHHLLQVAILLAAVFLAVFFRQSWGRGSYAWMMLFISLYVVFLFALLGEWSPAIFLVRIYDTCLGAAAALIATYGVHSPNARFRLQRETDEWWHSCRSELESAVACFVERREAASHAHPRFLLQLETLQTQAGEALYETFLHPSARRRALDRFAVTEMVCYFALGLFDAMACARHSPARERLGGMLNQLIQPVARAELDDFFVAETEDEQNTPTPSVLNACRLAIEQSNAAGCSGDDLVWSIPALYYAAALSESIRDRTQLAPQPGRGGE